MVLEIAANVTLFTLRTFYCFGGRQFSLSLNERAMVCLLWELLLEFLALVNYGWLNICGILLISPQRQSIYLWGQSSDKFLWPTICDIELRVWLTNNPCRVTDGYMGYFNWLKLYNRRQLHIKYILPHCSLSLRPILEPHGKAADPIPNAT